MGDAADQRDATPQTARRPSVVFTLDDGAPGEQAKAPEEPWWSENRPKKEPPKKSVRMPKSLAELHKMALLQHEQTTGSKLGEGQRLRLYFKGRELTHQSYLTDVHDGNEVVVKLERERVLQHTGHQFVSTARTEFVTFPIKAKAKHVVVSNARGSTLSDQQMGNSFDGKSSYRSDFVLYDRDARPAVSTKAMHASSFLKDASTSDATGQSTYATNFSSLNALRGKGTEEAGPLSISIRHSAVGEQLFGHRFDAKSSYGTDFAKRERFIPPAEPSSNDIKISRLTVEHMGKTFEGRSQYSSDFVNYNVDARSRSARPARFQPDEDEKFEGASEYSAQYILQQAKPPVLHLLTSS